MATPPPPRSAAAPLYARLLLLAKSAKGLPNSSNLGSSSTKDLGNGHDDDDPVAAVSRIPEDMEQGGQSIIGLDHLALTGLLTMDGTRYIWHRDEVQTSCMLFYLRVVPTCVGLIPAHMIRDKVASIMFLYLQHSNEKVTSASHSVMVSFLSSGNDTEQDDRTALKEQLTFYYIKRSLEAYPGVTPFEGLASGVAALVRHLPAGSPAILFCIHSLVVKAKNLCDTAKVQDKSLWRSWEGSTEPCKKILDLLLRLIFLVDIQSFPYLLKEMAEFVTLLPKEGQDALLDDMHAHVAESDDVTRKPVLVSWLQSLSYISSQSSCSESHSKATSASSVLSDELSLNRTMARL